jgi:hypothetical protein
MITNERRAFKRVSCKYDVTFKPHAAPGSHSGTSVTKNISLGGVYFTSFERFDIGQLLDCSINIPKTAEAGKWLARVVRCEDLEGQVVKIYGIAVEFVKSFGDAEKKLKKTLDEK